MKTFTIALIIILNLNIVYTQQTPRAEIFIMNRNITKDIYVRVIPVGFVFNMKPLRTIENYDDLNGFTRDYRYTAEADNDKSNLVDNYIFAGSKRLLKSNNGSEHDPLRGFFYHGMFQAMMLVTVYLELVSTE